MAARRQHQQAQIAGKRPRAQIACIRFRQKLRCRHVQPLDLCDAGDTRQQAINAVAATFLRQQRLARQTRARPDKAHVAAQHVPQLRQLVELGATQPGASSGDAAKLGFVRRAIAGANAHGAQFDQAEAATIAAKTFLNKDWIGAVADPDQDKRHDADRDGWSR